MYEKKFKSHNELYEECKKLRESDDNVCQSIIDIVEEPFVFLPRFDLQNDYLDYDEIETIWKIKRSKNIIE